MNLKEKRKELFDSYRNRNIPSSLIGLIIAQDKQFIKDLKERCNSKFESCIDYEILILIINNIAGEYRYG